jgi:hypothetical protein
MNAADELYFSLPGWRKALTPIYGPIVLTSPPRLPLIKPVFRYEDNIGIFYDGGIKAALLVHEYGKKNDQQQTNTRRQKVLEAQKLELALLDDIASSFEAKMNETIIGLMRIRVRRVPFQQVKQEEILNSIQKFMLQNPKAEFAPQGYTLKITEGKLVAENRLAEELTKSGFNKVTF